MAVADPHNDAAHDDHHDHGEFIAHHFDSAEQQFDSGKLGIWAFLVTEVLFFSGLFVAYILYRNHHPEIFEQAHVFLDKWLGGLNTIVLLFSSLTMALAVRAAQLGENKKVAKHVLITMVCAAVFLGVKAVEYSHKWDIGIFPREWFDKATLANYINTHAHPPETMISGLSDRLVMLSVIPLILLVLFLVGGFVVKTMNKPVLSSFLLGMAITVGGYFLGAGGGVIYQKTLDANGGGGAHASVVAPDNGPMVLLASTEDPAEEDTGHTHADGTHHGDDEHHGSGHGDVKAEDFDRDIGIFFSIYYCMSGLHAIHIIGGIIALAWVFYRALAGHWRPDYFGPVDYVGLYWHLVDLIWIYLFPMLYLID